MRAGVTLEQLRIFVAVAEREHVTLGARDLNLTQSATSAAIAALEARHATRLFDRVGRRIALTEAGRIFLEEARSVLARAQAAEAVLADLSELKRGALAIAASQTVGGYWLPERIGRFRARYPGIALTVSIGNTQAVATLVREGVADVGIVEGAVEATTLSVTPVAEDEMMLVAPPSHPWARDGAPTDEMPRDGAPTGEMPRDGVPTGEMPRDGAQEDAARAGWVAQADWVARERGSGTRAIHDVLTGGAVPDDRLLVLPSNEAVRGAVIAGAGVAVLSRLVVADALALGLLVAVKRDLPMRHFLAICHKERHRTRAAVEFCRLIGV